MDLRRYYKASRGDRIPAELFQIWKNAVKVLLWMSRNLENRWPQDGMVRFHSVPCESCSVVSYSLWPHGLYNPWSSPGQNTGVGSHSLLHGSSQPRDQTQVSRFAGGFFTSWVTREAPHTLCCVSLVVNFIPFCTAFASLKHSCFQTGARAQGHFPSSL